MLNTILNFLAKLVKTGAEPVEATLEGAIKVGDAWLDAKVLDSDNELDDEVKFIAEIALRDYLVKKHPLEDNPVD